MKKETKRVPIAQDSNVLSKKAKSRKKKEGGSNFRKYKTVSSKDVVCPEGTFPVSKYFLNEYPRIK